MQKRFLFSFLALIVIAIVVFTTVSTRPALVAPLVKQENRELHQTFSSGALTKSFFDDAYKTVPQQQHVAVLSALSAHHLLIANKIAELFDKIGSSSVRTVVLLSPNHFDQGKTSVQTTIGDWQTPYGIVETDDNAIHELATTAQLSLEPTTFVHEHGISALTPFIKRSFPNARLVPIVLHDSMTKEKADAIGNAIAKQFPNAVVIASADISHYLPDYIAKYHDEVTLHALAAGGCDGCNLEVDANSVMRTLFAVNKARGDEAWNLTDHDSSIELGAATVSDQNTSHILGYFTKGKPNTEPFAAIQFIGDIMLDRDIRKFIAKNGVEYPWEKMHRFLSGSNLVVGNLEGTVSTAVSNHAYISPFRFIFEPKSVEALKSYVDIVSLANNHAGDRLAIGETETHEALDKLGIPHFGSYHNTSLRFDKDVGGMKVTLIGYHAFAPNDAALIAEIKKAKVDGRFVIVYPHWGTEYELVHDAQQERLATEMSDAGADLIIGGHPHVTEGFDKIDNTPVAWSLGNFIFDQPMPETWSAMTLGVILKPNSIDLYLLPIVTKGGQPKPITDTDAKKFFTTLAAHSAPELKTQIEQGRITFPHVISTEGR